MSDPAPGSGCRSRVMWTKRTPSVQRSCAGCGFLARARPQLCLRLDRAAFEAGAPGGAQGRLPPGAGLHPLPAARRDPHHGGLRLGQRRRRPDVRRRGARAATRTSRGCRSWGRPASCWTSCSRRSACSASDVFICNTLKCRPPGNRDPHPEEIENCHEYLLRQVELIEPRVICTLGNFATKLLRGDPTGITRLHGRDEVRVIGTARGAAVSDLPPGGRALHAGQRRGPADRLRAPARAAGDGAAAAARPGGGAPRACPSRARCPTSPSSSPWPWRSTTARWGSSDGPPLGGDRLRALGRGLRARAARVPARGDRVAGARSSTCGPAGRSSTSRPAAASSPGRWRRWAARSSPSSPWPRCAPRSGRRRAPSTAPPRRCRCPTTAPTPSPSARPSTGSTGPRPWPRSSGCCAPAVRSRWPGTAARASPRSCTPRSAR